MPPGLTYKITGDILLNKPMTLIARGVTINSTAGRLRITSSKVIVDGYGSTINFVNGAPASSLDRAIRVEGTYNGSVLGIAAPIAAGASTFTATNAGDVAGLTLNQWIFVGEWVGTNQMRAEWKQVKGVVGTTVTVTSPFRRAYSLYTLGLTIMTPVEDVIVRGWTVVTTGIVDDNYGVDAEICRNFVLEDCRFDIAKGMAWQVYWQDAPTVRRNMVDRQVGRRSSIGTWMDGYCGYNRFGSKTSFCTEGALSIETAAAWNTIEANFAYGTGASGVFAIQEGYQNKFISNTIVGDGTSIGLFVFGGEDNQSIGNTYLNLLEGARFDESASFTPHFPADRNASICDTVRGATNGVNVRSPATKSRVYFLDTDSTVATPVLDNGTNTSQFNASNTTGEFAMASGTSIAQQAQITGAPSSVTQLLLGSSSTKGAVGTRFSGGDTFLVQNATSALGSDLWTQSNGAAASLLILLTNNGSVAFYSAAAGTGAAIFATFWTLIGTIDVNHFVNMAGAGGVKVGSTQVVQQRITGWNAPTTGGGGLLRGTFDTGATLLQTAETLAALITDLRTHGLINT